MIKKSNLKITPLAPMVTQLKIHSVSPESRPWDPWKLLEPARETLGLGNEVLQSFPRRSRCLETKVEMVPAPDPLWWVHLFPWPFLPLSCILYQNPPQGLPHEHSLSPYNGILNCSSQHFFHFNPILQLSLQSGVEPLHNINGSNQK